MRKRFKTMQIKNCSRGALSKGFITPSITETIPVQKVIPKTVHPDPVKPVAHKQKTEADMIAIAHEVLFKTFIQNVSAPYPKENPIARITGTPRYCQAHR